LTDPVYHRLAILTDDSGEGSGIEVARGLEEGEKLDVLGGLQVIHTPGHTPGSMSLYQEERGILLRAETRLLDCGFMAFARTRQNP
jgi:glyoxylase-like metal-dependent hydrolase (beta-lactamase superfamily II)